MRIQGLLRKTTLCTHWRADKGWPIQQWSVRSALLLACIVSVASAHGGSIIGGSTLLDSAGLDLLEGWLGEGELDVTNIFTKWEGATGGDFHAAADGMGRTFSLIEIVDVERNRLQIVGGYNPQSWSSIGDYNFTYSDAERTAFLFNLTNPTVFRQRLSSSNVWDAGAYQTANHPTFGPMFGVGHDLYIIWNLSVGYANPYSYRPEVDLGESITGTPINEGFYIGQIEVFTIASASPAVVPIPAPAALGLLGMGLIACKRRLRKGSSQA